MTRAMIERVQGSNIYEVDADYVKPGTATVHLLRPGNDIALLDTGTSYSVDNVSAALAELGLSWRDVRYIILTHIHLDHAGGASAMMRLAENARLVVHPKGARHMADPSKLIAGTKAVYGEQKYTELYGEILPIEQSRIWVPEDGEVLDFNGRQLTFIDTPGHASHHYAIWDEQSQSMFCGDILGISYEALRSGEALFLMPSTTPVQFDPEAMHASINRVMAYEPQHLYPTHYGRIPPDISAVAALHEQIDDLVLLTEQIASTVDAEQLEVQLVPAVIDYLHQRCKNVLPNIEQQSLETWINLDAELSAQGLAFWYQHRR